MNGTESGSVNARVIPSNASAALLTYDSSDEAVATVDSTGKVAAVANGQAVITVSCEDKTTQTKVTVTTKATSIRLEQGSGGALAVGSGIKLVARKKTASGAAQWHAAACGTRAV